MENRNEDIRQNIPYETIADFLLYKMEYIKNFDESTMNDYFFTNIIRKLLMIQKYHILQRKATKLLIDIITCQKSNDYYPGFLERHTYTNEELQIIDSYLLNSHDNDIFSLLK